MFVSVIVVRAVFAELRRNNIATDALCSELALDEASLLDLHTRISLDQLHHLVTRAVALTGDEGLGLTIGCRSPESMLQVLGHLVVSCRTMREALTVFRDYAGLVAEGMTWGLYEQRELASFSFECPIFMGPTTRFGAECVLTLASRIGMHFSADPEERPIEIAFQHPAPSYQYRYPSVFGCPVTFDRPRNEILFPRRMLDEPQPHADPTLCTVLRDAADRLLREVQAPRTVAERIRVQLRTQSTLAAVDPVQLARTVGLTRRSLRRRLADEGVSLTTLLDEERCRVACSELTRAEGSIKQVAERVGFSEPSAFHRAFKRWTGLTPLQYSRSRLGESEPLAELPASRPG
jgi:AraC-like DNA-binding protein